MSVVKTLIVQFLAVASLLTGSLASAHMGQREGSPMFPPDLLWDEDTLLTMDEPPLWPTEALDGYRSRVRLSVYGIARMHFAVRIDERADGSVRGTYISFIRGDRRITNRRRYNFRVSRGDFADLLQLMRDRSILSAPRQGWHLPNDEICLDGEEVLIEAVDADGYRAAGANVQCTAPATLLDVAERIVTLSRGPGRGLLGRQ